MSRAAFRSGRHTPADAPEALWLRRVCRLPVGDRLPEGRGLDCERLMRLARGHGLAARAGARVAAAEAVPEGAELLAADWRKGLGEQALLDEGLAAIAAAADASGIPMIALKGADLRRRLYGAGERPSNDLDLLVPPERREDAIERLASLGYRPCHPRDAHQRRHWFATTLRHQRWERIQVDLHWGLAAPGRARWDLKGVFRRSAPLDGVPGCRAMGAPDLAVYLALHAVAFHGAVGRWIWWLDLSLLGERGSLDRAPLVDHASAVGGRVAWDAARLRVRRLFGTEIGAGRPGLRAGAIDALARAVRGRDGPLIRRAVAALAVDPPGRLLRVVGSAARREWAARRGEPR